MVKQKNAWGYKQSHWDIEESWKEEKEFWSWYKRHQKHLASLARSKVPKSKYDKAYLEFDLAKAPYLKEMSKTELESVEQAERNVLWDRYFGGSVSLSILNAQKVFVRSWPEELEDMWLGLLRTPLPYKGQKEAPE